MSEFQKSLLKNISHVPFTIDDSKSEERFKGFVLILKVGGVGKKDLEWVVLKLLFFPILKTVHYEG